MILENEYAIDDTVTDTRKRYWGLDLGGQATGGSPATAASAGGVGGLLATVATKSSPATAGTETHYFHYDANGNVTETVDSNGILTASYEYSPFGELISSTGTYAVENTYRFSTKPIDVETGYYYYGYRFYDSSNGRWLNRDPIGEIGHKNLKAQNSKDMMLLKVLEQLILSQGANVLNNLNKTFSGENSLNDIGSGLSLFYELLNIRSGILSESSTKAELLGQNLYRFIRNNSINVIDLFGLAELIVNAVRDGVGHGWINVKSDNGTSKTHGRYPEGTNNSDAGRTPDSSSSFNIPQSTADKINALGQTDPGYDGLISGFLSNNCVDFVESALDLAGIQHPDFDFLGVSDHDKLADWLDEVEKLKNKVPCP